MPGQISIVGACGFISESYATAFLARASRAIAHRVRSGTAALERGWRTRVLGQSPFREAVLLATISGSVGAHRGFKICYQTSLIALATGHSLLAQCTP